MPLHATHPFTRPNVFSRANIVTTTINNELVPNDMELACFDLLSKQENVIDQLVQPDGRADEVGMLDGSLQIMTTFLAFSDKYNDDRAAIELASRLTELADRVALLKKQLLSQSSWFGRKTPASELRKEYLILGDAIAKMSAIELANCSRFFQPGSRHQKSFQESTLVFLREFKARW